MLLPQMSNSPVLLGLDYFIETLFVLFFDYLNVPFLFWISISVSKVTATVRTFPVCVWCIPAPSELLVWIGCAVQRAHDAAVVVSDVRKVHMCLVFRFR